MRRLLSALWCITIFASCTSENGKIKDQPTGFSSPMDSVNSLIKSDPNNSVLYYERAIMHYDNRDLSSSMSDVGRALKLDSSNVDFYLLLSNLKLLSKQSRESRNALIKAYNQDPLNIDVLLKLAEIYMLVENYEESFRYLNEALRVDIHNATAYRLKGFNYKYSGDTVNAISSFQTAIEQDPKDYDSYLQLGLLYSIPLKPIALDYYNNALLVRPSSLEALYAKAYHLQLIGESREAINLYNQIISLNEDYFNAHYNKGYVYLEHLNKYDSAVFAFTEAIEHGPKNYFQAVYNRGLSYERSNKIDNAEIDYRLALDINPQYDPAAEGLSRIGK